MDVLIAASESVPYCKTGGLADVVGALAFILGRMCDRVSVFLPYYRVAAEGGHSLQSVPGRYMTPVGNAQVPVTLKTTTLGSACVYFIENEGYFSRNGLYQDGEKDYPDNAERFIFYARAVLEGAKFLGLKPDVVHVHDWQAALLPAYLKTLYREDPCYARTGSVLTIHNAAYQGMFPKTALALAGFEASDFTPERLEYYGGLNFLKAGLVFADILSTVSPTYAAEIQSSSDMGRGLQGLLSKRSKDLFGILNGIDLEFWNPETDGFLAERYGPGNAPAGKAANKRALLRECGLAGSEEAPLVGIVSRLDAQKGLDLALSLVPKFLDRGVRFVVLGAGDPGLQKQWADAAARHPRSIHFRAGFNEPLAHLIYAGSDLFLMPSRFEPCGLVQMIAMRYGAVPVVTHTGGLADTVWETRSQAPKDVGSAAPNGFVASRCSPEDVSAALDRALSAYEKRSSWDRIRDSAMARDFSWGWSAQRYLELYHAAASRHAA